jgi:hypothetical protein
MNGIKNLRNSTTKLAYFYSMYQKHAVYGRTIFVGTQEPTNNQDTPLVHVITHCSPLKPFITAK